MYAFDNPLRFVDPTGLRPPREGPVKVLKELAPRWIFLEGTVIFYRPAELIVEVHEGYESWIDQYVEPDDEVLYEGRRYRRWKASCIRWIFSPPWSSKRWARFGRMLWKVLQGTGMVGNPGYPKFGVSTNHAVTGHLG